MEGHKNMSLYFSFSLLKSTKLLFFRLKKILVVIYLRASNGHKRSLFEFKESLSLCLFIYLFIFIFLTKSYKIRS